MKSVVKNNAMRFVILVLVCLVGGVARGADQPLSVDDIRLLLIGGAAPIKMQTLIAQRGINFRLTPELERKFRDDGAREAVIQELRKADRRATGTPTLGRSTPNAGERRGGGRSSGQSSSVPVTPAPMPRRPTPSTQPSSGAPDSTGAVQSPAATTPPAPSSNPNLAGEVARARTAIPAAKPSRADLSDPSPDRIQRIIQEFAAKEKLFKEARNNYAYHQSNKVQELNPEGEPGGVYEQEWDILYDDAGKRIERVTYAPLNTLSQLILTEEDLNAFRTINPFVLTSDELNEYETKYLGHVKVDEITAYVFSIRPKELVKGRQYFQGVIWVDDRDLQIVKSEGKSVGVLKKTKQENLFPRFTTYREQIDGKYWFPTFTTAEDTLNFSQGPAVHMKEIIRYSDYKQFKSKTRILSATPTDEPAAKPTTKPSARK